VPQARRALISMPVYLAGADHRNRNIKVMLCLMAVVRIDGPRGGIWWCEDCWGGGFLDHPPIGHHRRGCRFKDF
jgi:hypothetical protein